MAVVTESQQEVLLAAALGAVQHAHIPYSKYAVGAALQAADGTVYAGCNIENASYPAGICAERVALVKAVSEGQRRFERLVVVTSNGALPCGICRQMLSEFCPALLVYTFDMQQNRRFAGSLADLLPGAFGPDQLSV
ncbi:MAG: cytidine deaminase [Chloroflexi bacterium]|nr:cytidine deaminase [Chloroflexota bacterium]